MVRTHLETMVNFAVVLYLVTHGVSVPAEGRSDLVTCFCSAARAWLEGRRVTVASLLGSLGVFAST
jgi:hypothetical protein